MPALLTINGVTVECVTFDEPKRLTIGARGRTANGSAYSHVRGYKRIWHARSDFMSKTEVDNLRSATTLDTVVSVTQNIDGVTISAMVEIGDVDNFKDTGDGLLRQVDIVAEEA